MARVSPVCSRDVSCRVCKSAGLCYHHEKESREAYVASFITTPVCCISLGAVFRRSKIATGRPIDWLMPQFAHSQPRSGGSERSLTVAESRTLLLGPWLGLPGSSLASPYGSRLCLPGWTWALSDVTCIRLYSLDSAEGGTSLHTRVVDRCTPARGGCAVSRRAGHLHKSPGDPS